MKTKHMQHSFIRSNLLYIVADITDTKKLSGTDILANGIVVLMSGIAFMRYGFENPLLTTFILASAIGSMIIFNAHRSTSVRKALIPNLIINLLLFLITNVIGFALYDIFSQHGTLSSVYNDFSNSRGNIFEIIQIAGLFGMAFFGLIAIAGIAFGTKTRGGSD